jgi:pimeloyl-ACP methyl ester carboxylesterase
LPSISVYANRRDTIGILRAAKPIALYRGKLAALMPGAVHITDTHSGHFIMVDNAPVVIQAIRMVVDAVRAG